MNPEDVGKILDEIGERIGPAGEFAWQLTVRQVVIEGWVFGIVGVVALFVVVGSIYGMLRNLGDESSVDREFVAFFCSVGLGIFGLVALIMVIASVPKLLNPEYHAMVRLLERIVP